jgi:hypothetical protein
MVLDHAVRTPEARHLAVAASPTVELAAGDPVEFVTRDARHAEAASALGNAGPLTTRPGGDGGVSRGMRQSEHEPIETARPPLAGGDAPDALEPEALETEADRDGRADHRPPEKQPPSEPPEPD